MAFLGDAVEAITTHWAELAPLLDAPEQAEVREILAEADAEPESAANELRDLIKPLLPPGHPVREALTPSGLRYYGESTLAAERPALRAQLARLRAMAVIETRTERYQLIDTAPPVFTATSVTVSTAAGAPVFSLGPPFSRRPPYQPDADDAWLLAEPARPPADLDLTAEQVAQLIVVTDEAGVERAPDFQLDPATGTPYPVVVEINELLSADEDPWGAADWWLGSNVWLDAPPARLLGTGADHALLSAARAEISEL